MSVLDPAIGIAGELGVRAFATADWHNWTSAFKIGLFELSTRVGLPELKDQTLNQGLGIVFDTLDQTASAFVGNDNRGLFGDVVDEPEAEGEGLTATQVGPGWRRRVTT